MKSVRWMAALLLLALALPILFAGASPAQAQDVTPLVFDENGWTQVEVQELASGAELVYSLTLKTGDRVAMDLLPDDEPGAVAVTQFAAAYGALELETISPVTTMAWAPEDGDYTITVKNSGDAPAGFGLSVAVFAAPLPAKKIISADAEGQTVPVTVGETVQVVLDVQSDEGYAWTLQQFDGAVLVQEGDPATVLLGTVVHAQGRQIFTFAGAAPGTAALTFDYAKEGGAVEKSFAVTVEVMASEEAAASVEASGEATEEPVVAEESEPIIPDSITLDQGNVLVIPLAGNPSTGYLWQVKPSAEGILTERGDAAYASSSDMPGAPGYEIFTFDAVAAGDVTLTFTHSQPWDETTPPEQVIDLPFVVVAPPAPVETPAPPAPPQPIEIGESENGGTVEMQQGGALFVNLPGNPTTGYIWQITSKDDAYLKPLDYAFQPATDATGSGGVERFEFEAVAGGEVKLEFAQSRPWETDAEPVATYSVTVKIGAATAN